MYNYRDRAGFHGLGAPKVFKDVLGDIANQWMFQDPPQLTSTHLQLRACRVLGHETTWHPEVVRAKAEHGPGHCWVILDVWGHTAIWLEVLPSSKWRFP